MKYLRKETIRQLIYGTLSVVNKVIPKKRQIFVYGGNQLLDNSEAMLRYLAENTDERIVCIAENRMDYSVYPNIVFKDNSVYNAVKCCLTSRVIIESSLHQIKLVPAGKQRIIQMWHGSPLKHLPGNNKINNSRYYSYIFYGAPVFKEEMRSSFSAEESKMMLAGGPRNDLLIESHSLPEEYIGFDKYIIWMPTFRKGIGMIETNKDIPVINRDNVGIIGEHLLRNNIKLFIKPHPLQVSGLKEALGDYAGKNIEIITDADLRKRNIALYEFVGCMDALLTDYSSIFFDYLLLNRPIGFVIDDYEEYAANRGFAFEDPFAYMPGEFIDTAEKLMEFLSSVTLGDDNFMEKREEVCKITNYYRDANNRSRCMDLIIKGLDA